MNVLPWPKIKRPERLEEVRDWLKYHSIYVVYPIEVPRVCKVGIADDIRKRLSGIQMGNWYVLEVYTYFWTRGRHISKRLERAVLDMFTDDRIRGEWIGRSPKSVGAGIEAVAALNNVDLIYDLEFFKIIDDWGKLTRKEFIEKHLQ